MFWIFIILNMENPLEKAQEKADLALERDARKKQIFDEICTYYTENPGPEAENLLKFVCFHSLNDGIQLFKRLKTEAALDTFADIVCSDPIIYLTHPNAIDRLVSFAEGYEKINPRAARITDRFLKSIDTGTMLSNYKKGVLSFPDYFEQKFASVDNRTKEIYEKLQDYYAPKLSTRNLKLKTYNTSGQVEELDLQAEALLRQRITYEREENYKTSRIIEIIKEHWLAQGKSEDDFNAKLDEYMQNQVDEAKLNRAQKYLTNIPGELPAILSRGGCCYIGNCFGMSNDEVIALLEADRHARYTDLTYPGRKKSLTREFLEDLNELLSKKQREVVLSDDRTKCTLKIKETDQENDIELVADSDGQITNHVLANGEQIFELINRRGKTYFTPTPKTRLGYCTFEEIWLTYTVGSDFIVKGKVDDEEWWLVQNNTSSIIEAKSQDELKVVTGKTAYALFQETGFGEIKLYSSKSDEEYFSFGGIVYGHGLKNNGEMYAIVRATYENEIYLFEEKDGVLERLIIETDPDRIGRISKIFYSNGRFITVMKAENPDDPDNPKEYIEGIDVEFDEIISAWGMKEGKVVYLAREGDELEFTATDWGKGSGFIMKELLDVDVYESEFVIKILTPNNEVETYLGGVYYFGDGKTKPQVAYYDRQDVVGKAETKEGNFILIKATGGYVIRNVDEQPIPPINPNSSFVSLDHDTKNEFYYTRLNEDKGKYEICNKEGNPCYRGIVPISRDAKVLERGRVYVWNKVEDDHESMTWINGFGSLGKYDKIHEYIFANDCLFFIGSVDDEYFLVDGHNKKMSLGKFDEFVEFKHLSGANFSIQVKEGDEYKFYYVFFRDHEPRSVLTEYEKYKLELLKRLTDDDAIIADAFYKHVSRVDVLNDLSRTQVHTLEALIREYPGEFVQGLSAERDADPELLASELRDLLFCDGPDDIQKDQKERAVEVINPVAFFRLQDMKRFPSAPRNPEEGLEIIESRIELDELLITGYYGVYDEQSKVWKKSKAALDSSTDGSAFSTTFTFNISEQMTKCVLPKPPASRLSSNRVTGLTEDGEKVKLAHKITADGNVSVQDIPKEVIKIKYSLEIPVEKPKMAELNHKQYQKFKRVFTAKFGEEESAQIAQLPEELKLFLDSIKDLPPYLQIYVIKEFVKKIGHYDKEVYISDNLSIEDQIAMMQRKCAEPGKKYTGKCDQFAILQTALLRHAGFVSGIADGIHPKGDEGHAASYVVWPDENGNERRFVVDGTPAIESESIGLGSKLKGLVSWLISKFSFDRKPRPLTEKEKQKKLKKMKRLSEAKIEKLSNGELEQNISEFVLSGATDDATLVLNSLFNAYWFSPLHKIDIEDPSLKEQLSYLLSNIQTHGPEEFQGAGLVSVLEKNIARMLLNGDSSDIGEAYQKIRKIIDVVSGNLDENHRKAIKLVLNYLKP